MSRAVVTVVGEDRVGIVARVSSALAENGVNIEDISQTIMQDLFTMMMLVTVDESRIPIGDLQKRLAQVGGKMGVHITVQHEDLFRFMHRI
ncbi:MAG: ACT domain-containing protein [Actinobacteria bacterium]|nr:ACT domain-containing protein [Actinomycetota bacterium]